MIGCFNQLFFVLFIEEPLREQKERKREKELEKEEGTHNTLFIYYIKYHFKTRRLYFVL